MKKKFLFFLFLFTILILINNNSISAKEINKNKLNIYNKGVIENVDSQVTIDKANKKVDITETDGKDIKAEFNVDEEVFNAKINLENNKEIVLTGEKIPGDDLLYRGTVDDSSEIKVFEALLTLDDNKNKYKALINIKKYEKTISKDPIEVQTLTFNNNNKQIKHYSYPLTQQDSVLPKKESIIFTASSDPYNDDYFDFLTAVYTTYMETMISGPKQQRRDAANFQSVRSTTKSNAIADYWRDQGYSVYETTVGDWHLDFSGNSYSAYDAVDPGASSEKSINVPVYLGNAIGYQLIPLTTSSVSISNPGTRTLGIHFSWNDESDYYDDSGVTSDIGSKKGFAAKVSWDTTASIPLGYQYNNVTSKFTYRSQCFTLTSGGMFYASKTVSQNVRYAIEIIN